jgi:deoxyribodipyrimidine photo-lyase
MPSKIHIFWFRRDLRLEDNAGLYHALKTGVPVLPLFIFDKNILDKLYDRDDARVSFIHDALKKIKHQLQGADSDLLVRYGDPEQVWKSLMDEFQIDTVYLNRDYESYALSRDKNIQSMAESRGIRFQSFKDHIIFDKDEVVKDDGKPYTVFTPYKRKWMDKLHSRGNGESSYFLKAYPTSKYHNHFLKTKYKSPLIALEDMGFTPSSREWPSDHVPQSIIKNYEEHRNFPGQKGTSHLGIHFRFGTISIREKARKALSLSTTYLSELIWRDFYSMILYHFPHVETGAFRPEYDRIPWINDENDFLAWCHGKTGYPIVDAGMRELLHTGFMHNRVRMITASFLTKHLLIDWRWGEAWFARHLLDFDLASNNGGWQWASGSGTDAAPYFRIFSPDAQTEKFDKQRTYIKKWVPELGTPSYPAPVVDHKLARERCLAAYKAGLGK